MTPRLSGLLRGVRKAAFWTFATLGSAAAGYGLTALAINLGGW